MHRTAAATVATATTAERHVAVLPCDVIVRVAVAALPDSETTETGAASARGGKSDRERERAKKKKKKASCRNRRMSKLRCRCSTLTSLGNKERTNNPKQERGREILHQRDALTQMPRSDGQRWFR